MQKKEPSLQEKKDTEIKPLNMHISEDVPKPNPVNPVSPTNKNDNTENQK